jgi:hypothetical protein
MIMGGNKNMKTELDVSMPCSSEKLETTGMKPWSEMEWKDIYLEHRPIVRHALKSDARVEDIAQCYAPATLSRIETACVQGLKTIVDALRSKYPQDVRPVNCDWAEIVWDSNRREIIEKMILQDSSVVKELGVHKAHDSFNISIVVSDAYGDIVNERNIFSSSKSPEYQNGQ